MNCECEIHGRGEGDAPERSLVADRLDPADGRTRVRWCLDCFEYIGAQWGAYMDHLDGLDRDWQRDQF